jgi:lipoic acid synthetase
LSAEPLPLRLPAWARKGNPLAPGAHQLRVLLRDQSLNTVCEEARCPNLGDCFSRGTATFMVLGDRCTRRCDYCSIATAKPLPPDPDEPARVAAAAARLGLRYVVLTGVARDDLDDGGASHYAATVAAIRRALPGASVEVLTPDFRGESSALRAVLAAEPDVFNHNLETVARVFPAIRAQGDYRRSLEVLAAAKEIRPGQVTKSGLMVGLGETDEEVDGALFDLARVGVDIVTLGQYLRPTLAHAPVARYVPPEGFAALADRARAHGIATVYAGVFVRSSFNAEEVAHRHQTALPGSGRTS